MALAAVVAFAPVARGVHYLHDIALGAALSVTVTVFVVALSERMRRPLRTGAQPRHE